MLTATAKTYRNAYSGLSKQTWLLSLIMLINRSGTMVVPFMTLYLTSPEMGYSIGEAGIVFGLFGAGAFCGAWLGGRITDKIGFYPVQLFTLTVGGILFMVLGQMKTYPLICTFTFLLSFVNEAFRPANSTAIAFYSKEGNRTRSYALNRLAINLGWAIGSALGGFLADINYELLFWVDGFTNIGAALLMWSVLKPVNYKSPAKTKIDDPLIQSAYKDKTYLSFALITMLFACCFFQLFNNLPVYFNKELNFSKPFIGILMAANGVIIVLVEMVLIYKLEGKRRHMIYITLGVFMVGLSFLLLNIPGAPVAIAVSMIVLVTFGEILSMPFMNSYWIARTQPSNRGQYAALYTMAWSAAQTLGPMGGAQIAEHAGFNILWWTVGGLSIIASLSFWKLHKKG
ncbi:MAG: MFS transporter [Chitinophagaceae bacterium]|nr:MFS transporter [Chitinophagaceae bacterium]MBK9568915.1 MFS transporter [Chitinophagaceae bacterium]